MERSCLGTGRVRREFATLRKLPPARVLTPVSPLILLLVMSLATDPGQVVVQPHRADSEAESEALCESERAVFYETVTEQRGEGNAARERLLADAGQLLATFEPSAPVCAGRLREHEAVLLVMSRQYESAATRIAAFLAGPGQRTSPRSKIRLGVQRAYVLSQLGRSVESARAYFDTAALAADAPAREGVRALIEAAATARVLGDLSGSERYLTSALDLVSDSLEAEPRLLSSRGHALLSLALLAETKLERAPAGDERDSLVTRLQTVAGQAVDDLEQEGQDAGFRAIAMGKLALALAYQGRLDDARSLLDDALALARSATAWLPNAVSDTHILRSEVCEIAGDVPCADREARRAQDAAIEQNNSYREATAVIRRAELAERRQEWREAAALYEEAIVNREVVRSRLGLQDWSASAFAAMQEPYRGLIRTRLALGDSEEAFLILDRTRARYLQDLQQHHSQRARLTEEARFQIDSLTSALGDARLAFRAAPSATVAARETQRISELQTQIERLVPLPDSTLELTRLGPVQEMLQSQARTLVTYFLDDRQSVAFILRPDTLVVVDLDTTPGAIQQLLADVGSPWQPGMPPDPAFSLRALHSLYTSLVAPVVPWIDTDRIAIIPDGDLASVPFAALVESPSDSFSDAQYLIRRYSLSTELAAAMIADRGTNSAGQGDALLMGRRDFDRFTWNGGSLPDLPSVSDELRGVGRHLLDRKLMDGDATESAFRDLAPGAGVIHIASHAWVDASFPLYSWVALTASEADDGMLYLYELMSQPLAAEMVTLSGCDTGSGNAQGGEGLVGLQYAVRASGARSSLATLWPVADDAMAVLMEDIYDALGEGLSKDEALQKAQLAYLDRASGLEASPFYWSAPTLSGDVSPLTVQSGGMWLWGALALIALGATGIAWRIHSPRDRVRRL